MSQPVQEGRTTVITGVASGIGRATAELLRSRGERVVGIDLSGSDLDADLSLADGREQVLTQVRQWCPAGIDALIACAGLSTDNGPDVVSVNYFGAVELAEGLRPLLARGRSPRAVLVSSSAALLEVDGNVVARCLAGDEAGARGAARSDSAEHATARQGLIYGASKSALLRWIRRAAPRPNWGGAGILLNGIAPGLVRTPMTLPLLATREGRAVLAQAVPRAVAEPADPEDIALLLAFLASADNRYLVGQVPFCDGGTEVIIRSEEGA